MSDKQRDFLSVRPFAVRDIDSVLQSLPDTSWVLQGFSNDFWKEPALGKFRLGFVPLAEFGLGYSNLNEDVWTA
jgi:hypothetical protein